jgi:hypothetical protein
MAEWSKAADCKSAGVRLRRFEPYSHHHLYIMKADLAQQVEHIHGKDGVSGSSPEVGSSVSKGSPVIFGTLFLFVCHMTVCTI